MGVCVGVCVSVCVQPDTASHTLSVFSISYHQVERLVTEEVGQAIRLGGSFLELNILEYCCVASQIARSIY